MDTVLYCRIDKPEVTDRVESFIDVHFSDIRTFARTRRFFEAQHGTECNFKCLLALHETVLPRTWGPPLEEQLNQDRTICFLQYTE
jgi:hypothetical protein